MDDSSTLFYSAEKVFEESTFHRFTIDVIYMFFWTLVTQVMLGWIYYPIQIIPEFGGLQLSQLALQCTLCLFAARLHPRAAPRPWRWRA